MTDFEALRNAVIKGKRNDVTAIVQEAINNHEDINAILDKGMIPAMHAELAEFPYARTVERVRIRCSKIENIGLLGASACHE